MAAITVTFDKAQSIISKDVGGDDSSVTSISELEHDGWSLLRSQRFYMIQLEQKAQIYILLVSEQHNNQPLCALPLPITRYLLDLVHKSTSIPMPKPHTLDESRTTIPWDYLLLSLPEHISTNAATAQRLSVLREHGILSPQQDALLDVRTGTYLQQLHAIQNDWFGTPLSEGSTPPDMDCYSWQDTFVLLLDELLTEVNASSDDDPSYDLPAEDIRRYLSRAIGSFLFEDVEVPSLIWFTGSAEDVFVSGATATLTRPSDQVSKESHGEPEVCFILPSFCRAIWGDPLLETFFMPPGPSEAMKEAYAEAGGGPLITFARQRTKRLWYTLLLTLLVLAGEQRTAKTSSEQVDGGKGKWARDILPKCIDALKDAPCY